MKLSSNIGRMKSTAFLASALALVLLPSVGLAQDKIKIEKADDLPRQTYAVTGSVSDLYASHEKVLALAEQVRKDTEDILAKYDIQDKATLQGLYATLATVAMLQGDEAKATEYQLKARDLEDKESKRLLSGVVTRPFFAARKETGESPDSPEFRAAFKTGFAAEVKPLPWDVVGDNLEQMKGQAEMISEPMLTGMIQATLDPSVAKSGFLSGDQARQVLNMRVATETFLPLKAEIDSVLSDVVAANRVEKKDIWADRNVTLDATPGAPPVPVGIWDTGVDVSDYLDHMWANPHEQMDGKDDDGNGYVDDVHGIAYDLHQDRVTDLIYPLGDAEADRAQLEGMFKGLLDVQASIDSPEATAFKQTMASMKPEAVSKFLEEMTLYTFHAHGTHVAGISIEGNPQAEIVVARLGLDHHLVPIAPTMELAHKSAQEDQDVINYFKAAGVRVVNMSWGGSAQELEQDLQKNSIGKNEEERAQMAREMFAVEKEGLRKAFESAPGIVFVAAAGNSDSDVNFDEFIPASFDLPNMIVVGAVDQAGDATSFTSFGKSVDVYSNGFEVKSLVPGGHHMKLSGTSMASPNVANLAAKLIAIDPSLTPEQTIGLIEQGAEPGGKDGKLLIINPRRSVEMLRQKNGMKG